MSRRAMILLILAIVAVHGILLWLVVATGSNEQKIAETRKQIAEENALRSAMESGEVLPSETQDESAPEVVQPPSGGQTTASAGLPPPTGDLPAILPETKDKPVPSVPSTTYVRRPKKTALAFLR